MSLHQPPSLPGYLAYFRGGQGVIFDPAQVLGSYVCPTVGAYWLLTTWGIPGADLDKDAIALLVKVVEGPRERGHQKPIRLYQKPTCHYIIDFGAFRGANLVT